MLTRNVKKFGIAGASLCLAVLTACSSAPSPSYAQTTYAAQNIPVLVMGDDSEDTSMRRSSGIYREVLIALSTQMARQGFQVVDAEGAGSQLGFEYPDRMSRSDLWDVFRALDNSNLAVTDVRALIFFRIHASVEQQSFSTRVQTRVVGEIFDGETNQLVNSFALPPETYAAPADCMDNLDNCINMVIRPRAGDIAANLGNTLAVQLEAYAPKPQQTATGTVTGSTGQTASTIGAGTPLCANPPKVFTIELRNFQNREAFTVMGVMEDEFPCRMEVDQLANSNNAIRRYKYVTTARQAKIEEWLYILFEDMGFNTDNQIRINMLSGGVVRIDKVVPTPLRAPSADETSRFN